MEQPTEVGGTDRETGYLTAKSAAIAGFTFAALSMLGQGSATMALQSLFWGPNYPMGDVLDVMAVWGVGTALLAGAGIWLGRRAVGSAVDAAAAGWESHLGRAAVLVAGAGLVLSVLTIVASLVRNV